MGEIVSSRSVVSDHCVNAETAEDALKGDMGIWRGSSTATGVFVPVGGMSRILKRMGSPTPE